MTAPRLWMGVCGLLAAPVLWIASVQLGQVLPYADCGHAWRGSFWLPCLAAILAVAGGWLAWRSAAGRRGAAGFVLRVGAGLAVVFTLALLLQGLAGWMLTGCER
ncbi:hypothetical protein IBL26_06315 [Roseomonas aerophila]|uniref:Transmembrane protein n=1 Tax=Teichococcus aerophilus TaxID=1224513 RepID=A0ABR7RIP1_9PROT|nr:hypothetical protein [Pseudoroseomonas aerophila]MBC9206444.1 hypothetical protein [Pseudoroseomonas aerophila]